MGVREGLRSRDGGHGGEGGLRAREDMGAREGRRVSRPLGTGDYWRVRETGEGL